jgi:hypothetical protein
MYCLSVHVSSSMQPGETLFTVFRSHSFSVTPLVYIVDPEGHCDVTNIRALYLTSSGNTASFVLWYSLCRLAVFTKQCCYLEVRYGHLSAAVDTPVQVSVPLIAAPVRSNPLAYVPQDSNNISSWCPGWGLVMGYCGPRDQASGWEDFVSI